MPLMACSISWRPLPVVRFPSPARYERPLEPGVTQRCTYRWNLRRRGLLARRCHLAGPPRGRGRLAARV
jgi:hypothetical protein